MSGGDYAFGPTLTPAAAASSSGPDPRFTIIRIQIGATTLQTTLGTLQQYPGSLLHEMFSPPFQFYQSERNAHVLPSSFDVDSFRIVLDFLRCDAWTPILNPSLYNRVCRTCTLLGVPSYPRAPGVTQPVEAPTARAPPARSLSPSRNVLAGTVTTSKGVPLSGRGPAWKPTPPPTLSTSKESERWSRDELEIESHTVGDQVPETLQQLGERGYRVVAERPADGNSKHPARTILTLQRKIPSLPTLDSVLNPADPRAADLASLRLIRENA
jgi:hypothetical protein